MELKKLYPRWLINHSISDQTINSIDRIYPALKLSLIHQVYLTDLFAVDHGRHGIEVNRIFWSYTHERIYKVNELTYLAHSVYWLWPSASWLEREVWEMFGLRFNHHPDLRRLLTDYGFRGWPLLKEYPTVGYHQLSYSERYKRIIAQPTNLNQEFRQFNFKSPWLE